LLNVCNAHCLKHRTTSKIQNGQRVWKEVCLPLGFGASFFERLRSSVFYFATHRIPNLDCSLVSYDFTPPDPSIQENVPQLPYNYHIYAIFQTTLHFLSLSFQGSSLSVNLFKMIGSSYFAFIPFWVFEILYSATGSTNNFLITPFFRG